jgi:hypothetical protein
VVHYPQIVGDTLAGRIATRSGNVIALHVPWASVQQVERRRTDANQTVELVVVTGPVLLVVAAAAIGDALRHAFHN